MFDKSVLVLFASGGDFSLQMVSGVCAYAQAVGWRINSAEYQAVNHKFIKMMRAPAETLRGVVDFWKPDGCIVDFGGGSGTWMDAPLAGIPTVYLERYNPQKGFPVCVYGDSESVVHVAARELLRFDLSDYAYVPWTQESAWWSRERLEHFSDILQREQRRLHVYHRPSRASSAEGALEHLGGWLARLPKPCGVFAANDVIGESVLVACARKGIVVPRDMIVVGVDDSAYVCEGTRPTLSSVGRNFSNAGSIAAGLLDEMMAHPGKAYASRRFPAAGLVRRQSSSYLPKANAAVCRAVEYIRLHACEGIGPRDVVAEMAVSRTPADIAFRKGVGHSILDEIHAVRLANAKAFLLSGMSAATVADRCGYSSLADFRRVFRLRTGETVGAFMRSGR